MRPVKITNRAGRLLLVVPLSLFFLSSTLFAKIDQWDFQSPEQYQFDSQKVEVVDGVAKLKASRPFIDQSREDFDKGNYDLNTWAGRGKLELAAPALQEIAGPDLAVPLIGGEPGLVALWPFNEPNGTNVLDEASRTVAKTSDTEVVSSQVGFGYARSFDGAKSHVFIPYYRTFQFNKAFTVEAWIRPRITLRSKPQTIISRWQAVGAQKGFALQISSEGKLDLLTSPDGALTMHHTGDTVLAGGLWYHVAAVYNGETLQVYLNGVPDALPTAFGNGIHEASNPFYLGALIQNNLDEFFDGAMDQVAFYTRPLNEIEIRTHAGNSRGLIGLWHLNERGSLLADSSGYGLNAMSYGDPHYEVEGKVGTGLYFDGQTQQLETNPSVRAAIDDNLTLAAWIKPEKVPGLGQAATIISSVADPASTVPGKEFSLALAGPDGALRATASDINPGETFGKTSLMPNVWQHVAATWSAGRVSLYVNGVLDSSSTYTGKIVTGKAALRMAMDAKRTAGFSGTLDEVAVYRRALTDLEIAALAGALSQGGVYTSQVKDAGSDSVWRRFSWKESLAGGKEIEAKETGLLHLYHLNEKDQTSLRDTKGEIALDAVGAYAVNGIFNQARWFAAKGHDKIISQKNFPSLSTFTLSFWFQFATSQPDTGDRLFSIGDSNPTAFRGMDGRIRVTMLGAREVLGQRILRDTRWHHFAITADGRNLFLYIDGVLDGNSPFLSATAEAPLVLGNLKSMDTFQGAIDEFAFMNYPVTRDQIYQHYLQGQVRTRFQIRTSNEPDFSGIPWRNLQGEKQIPPDAGAYTAGLWHFDEKNFLGRPDEITDAGRFANHGSIYGRPVSVPSAIAGSGLSLNGSGDYVQIPDGDSMHLRDFTLSAWIKPRQIQEQDAVILDKHFEKGAPSFSSYALELTSGNRLKVRVGHSGGYIQINTDKNGEIAAGQWNHVAAAYNGKEIRLYINGKLRKIALFEETVIYDSGALYVGRYGAGASRYFDGEIDELSIESYARSDEEMAFVYNGLVPRVSQDTEVLLEIDRGRYFQYRAFLETAVPAAGPTVEAVEIQANAFSADRPWIMNQTGVSFADISHFSEKTGAAHRGAISYQLSNDGANWFYHNGRRWVIANGATESNTAVQIQERIQDFAKEVGIGSFFFKAFLHSTTGIEPAELESVELDYLPNKLTMISPNGGEAWRIGSSEVISWNSTGDVASVRLEYTKDDFKTNFQVIAKDLSNTGNYTWKIPDDAATLVKVRVLDSLEPRVHDTSDLSFRIVGAFEVISPNWNERWEAGSKQEIRWNTVGTIPEVRIDYSTDEFTNAIYPIIDSIKNDGKYQWNVTEPLSHTVKVRVSDVRDPLVSDKSNDTFTIHGRLELLSPQAGDRWIVGSNQEIRWQSIGAIAAVRVEYRTSMDQEWKPIVKKLLNQKSFNWKVPDLIDNGLHIQITDLNDPKTIVAGPSFSIVGGLRLINPKGGEKWTVGSRRKIAWQTIGTVPLVNLEYKLSAKDEWLTIAKQIANTGEYIWDVPAQGADFAEVRISSDADPSITANSSTPIQVVPSFVMRAPNGGESFKIGSEVTIIWETQGVAEKIRLDYSKDNFSKHSQAIIDEASNIGQFSWTIPDDATLTARVRISHAEIPSSNDISDSDFRIFPDFKITMPKGGEKLEVGSIATLTWETTGTVPEVRLEYSHDNFAKDVRTIAGAVINENRLSWTVPDDIGSDYSIRIADTRDLQAQAYSEGGFSILGDFRLIEPAGEENVIAGTMIPIKWKGAGSVPFLRLDYSEDNFEKSFKAIADEAPNTGIYEWTVPNLVGHKFKIRIWDPSHPEAQDIMSHPARIVSGFRLSAPNGGEVFYVGDDVVVEWETYGTVPTVRLDYSSDNFKREGGEIADRYENIGAYKWRVPDMPAGSYRLRVSDARDVTAFDLSNADFKIRSRFILLSPNGGEGWTVGDKKLITWQTTGSVGTVNLEYSIDDFASVTNIAEKAPNTGSFEWMIPDNVTQNVKVRISDTKDFEALDVSDGAFHIQGILTLEAPMGGEVWKAGDPHAIQWKTTGRIEGVRLDYSHDNFASEIKTIAETLPNTGTFNWTAPDDLSPNTKVRVMDLKDPAVQSISPNPFEIAAAFLLMAPNGGEKWFASEKREITWATIGSVREVILQLSSDDFATEPETIDHGILNAGRFTWELPRQVGNNFKVRVCDANSPKVCDVSDTPFAIEPPFDLTYPKGGERWAVGSDQELYWNVHGYIPRVYIQYATEEPPVEWKVLAEELVNEGHLLFRVPDDISKTVYFRVADYEDTSLNAMTQEPVEFIGTFEILTPNGGEKWLASTTQKINWNTLGTAPEVRLEYSTDDFQHSIQLIESALKNVGSYDWVVPAELAPAVKIRIQDASNPAAFDISDKPFKILPHFSLVAPNGGERWKVGEKVQIEWKTEGVVPRIRLEYGMRASDDENYAWQPIAEVRGTRESFEWEVPETVSSDVKIRLYDDRDADTTVESAKPFKILGRFRPLAPKANETLFVDGNYEIKWETYGRVPSVKLEYAVLNKNEKEPVLKTIEPLWNNTGSYFWTVPDDMQESLAIRISDSQEPESFAVSEVFNVRGILKFEMPDQELFWPVGSQQTLSWKTTGSISHVRLEYSTDGKIWKLIEESIPNGGSYGWLIPDDLSKTVRLRVLDVRNPSVFAEYDKLISIMAAFKFTRPIAGEKWPVASSQKITWSALGSVQRVVLEYALNDEWQPVAGPMANELAYEWTIPDTIHSALRLRIRDAENPVAAAVSEPFAIIGTLDLTSPLGDEVWAVGSQHAITWQTTGTLPYIRIEGLLEQEGVASTTFLIAEKIENKGTFDWVVPDKISNHLKIQISDFENVEVNSVSQKSFAVIGSLQILNPKDSETLRVGTSQQIAWSTQGTIPSVILEYSNDDFYHDVNLIASGIPNTGAAVWTVPDAIAAKVQVRITDLNDKRAFGLSEPFAIKGKLDFITPAEDSTLKVAGKVMVRWQSAGSIPTVRLEFSRDNFERDVQVIENALPNQDFYEWQIPDIISNTVKLRLTDTRDASVSALSSPFKVEGSLNITPLSEERVQVLSTQRVLWETVGTISKVRLEYSRDDFDKDIHMIASEVSNQGMYEWIVPDDIGAGVKIRVSNPSNFSVSSVSPEPFEIHGSLSFTTTTAGQRWPVASQKEITWQNVGTIPFVRLEYSTDDFEKDIQLIADALPNQGRYEWTIPDTISDHVRFRIQDSRDTAVAAVTSQPLAIIGELEFLEPVAGTTLFVEDQLPIRWAAVGTLPRVRLEYQTEKMSASSWKLVTGLAESSGEFFWTVPDDIALQARIRVSDSRDSAVQAVSGDFAIAGKLNLLSPAGNERWIVGTRHDLSWNSVGTLPEITLQVSQDHFEKDIRTLAERIPNAGRFLWDVPDSISDSIQIRILDPRMPEKVYSISPSFAVVGDFVVAAPAVPQVWKVGSDARLEWQTLGTIPAVRLEYWLSEDEHRVIQDNIPNEGFYTFRVPDWAGTEGILKLSDSRDPYVIQSTPSIKVEGELSWKSPLQPESWKVGDKKFLEWHTVGTIPQVKLEYSRDHFQQDIQLIADALKNEQKFLWEVPDAIGEGVQFRITDQNDAEVSSLTPQPISILGGLQLKSLGTGSLFKVGEELPLAWETIGSVPAVRLEYQTLEGSTSADSWKTIAAPIENTGTYTWKIPDAIGFKTRVRISDIRFAQVQNISEEFAIAGELKMLAPEGDERWIVGTQHDLSWKTLGTLPEVTLQFSQDQFRNDIRTIAEKIPNVGRFVWNVPDSISDFLQVRVLDPRMPEQVSSTSPSFSIVGDFILTTPVESQVWKVGRETRLEWQTIGTIPTVRLEYWLSDDDRRIIQDNITNEGFYNFNAPDWGGTQGVLKLSDSRDSRVTQSTPSIKIEGELAWKYPLQSESWKVGEKKLLEWNTVGTISQVKLEYSRDHFQTDRQLIADALTNEQKFLWEVPDAIGEGIQFRITNQMDAAVSSVTTQPISILGDLQLKSLGTQPIFKVGEELQLNWDTTGTIPAVRLEYQTLDGSESSPSWKFIAGPVENLGSYTWKIPDAISFKTQVRISDAQFVQVQNISQEFAIVGQLKLMVPEGGERWMVGDTRELLWESTGTIPAVNLYYSTNGFVQEKLLISENAVNTGKWNWTVPDSITHQMQIRVEDARMPQQVSSVSSSMSVAGELIFVTPSIPATWKVGSNVRMEWQTVGTLPKIKMEYVVSATGETILLQDQVPNEGNHTFRVPDWTGKSGVMRISDTRDASVHALSPILKIEGAFQFLSPKTGETWKAGEERLLEWQTTGTIPNVALDYSTDYFQRDVQPIKLLIPNENRVLWKVPDHFGPIRIRVRDSVDSAIAGISNEVQIRGSVEVLQPVANEAFEVGSQQTIAWKTLGSIPQVRLEYSEEGFKNQISVIEPKIETSRLLTGEGLYTYRWQVPDFISSRVQIRVTDARDAAISNDSEPFKIKGRFEVTAPHGGELWTVGETHEISWSSMGSIPSIRLEYSRDGFQNDVQPIAAGIKNEGRYSWSVADAIGTQIWVRVVDERDASVWAMQERPIEVQGALELTSPLGGEVWTVGSDKKIEWKTTGSIKDITLEYIPVQNTEELSQVIARQVPNLGNYIWQLSDEIPAYFQIRVTDSANPRVVSETRHPIKLLGALKIISPDSQQRWAVGSNQRIVWETRGVIPQVKVEYSRDGFQNEVGVLFPLLSNAGSVQWTVSDLISKNFQVRVSDIQNPEVAALSPAPIEIFGGFHLLTPAPQARLEIGDSVDISWQTVGTIPNVRLEYDRTERFLEPRVIAEKTSNNGHLTWEVPAELGDQFWIRISDADHSDIRTISAAPFQIQGRLKLLVPQGGEIWKVGEQVPLLWETTGPITAVALEYSVDDFLNMTPIVENISNEGKYTWRVPDMISDKVRVRVRDVQNPDVISSIIHPVKVQGSLAFLAPHAREFWESGTPHTILWQTVGTIPFVSLEYSTDNFATVVPILLGLANEGRYAWTVPDISTETLKIRLTAAHDHTVSVMSEPVEVGGTLTLQVPGGGEIYKVDDQVDFQWKTGGTISRVRLEISRDQFVSDIQVLESALDNQGHYLWKVPDQIAEGYRLRISDIKNEKISAASNGTFKIEGRLEMTAPQGGEVWAVNSTQRLQWQTVGTIPVVHLEYSKDQFASVLPVATNVQNVGQFSWEVPDLAGETVQFRVFDARDPHVAGATVHPVQIEASIQLTSPQGGEIWRATESKPITWRTAGTIGQVNLEYSLNDFETTQSIANSISNTGSYMWAIPDITTRNLKIRVSHSLNPEVTDQNDVPVQLFGEMKITSPLGGEVWMVGSEHPISWTSTGNIETVRLEYSTDGFRSIFPIALRVANTGSYTWTVPDSISKTVVMRVVSEGSLTVSSESPAPFEIRGALHLLTPTGGEVWNVGSRHPISWQTVGTIPQVQLEYSTDNFESHKKLIAANLDNKGVYYWDVPVMTAPGLKVRITDVNNPEVYDISGMEARLSGTLELLQPAGGEVFEVGQRIEVRWRSTTNIANVKLEYTTDQFETTTVISDYIPNSGKFVWNIPDVITEQMRIKVSDATDASVNSFSRFPFRTRGSLKMMTPKGGESWVAGSKQTLTWSTTGRIPKIRLEYSADHFETAIPIAAHIDNTGSYVWTVPDLPASEIKFRVIDANAPSNFATTEGGVKITGQVQMLIPAGKERWIVGEEKMIRWQSSGYIPTVDLEYSKDNFKKDIRLIDSKIPNVGSYSWHIPNDVAKAVRIRVRSSEDRKLESTSETFSLDFHKVTWMVRDSQSKDHLTGLVLTDSTGKTISKVSSPVNFEYPYGIYTTVWTKAGYGEVRSTWLADRDRTFEVLLEPKQEKLEVVRGGFEYDRDKDLMKVTTWYEKNDKSVPAVIESEVKIYKREELIKTLFSSTPDNLGYFHMVFDTSVLEGDAKYFASVALLTASGQLLTSPMSYQLDIPVKERKEAVQRQAVTSENLKPMVAPEPAKEIPEETPKPKQVKTQPVSETPQDANLVVPKTAVINETISVVYVGDLDSNPVLDLYDSNKRLVIRGARMQETEMPGTYTYSIAIKGLSFMPNKPVKINVIEAATGDFKSAEVMITSSATAVGYDQEMGGKTVLNILGQLDRMHRDIQRIEGDRSKMAEILASLEDNLSSLASMMTADFLNPKVLDKLNKISQDLALVTEKKGYSAGFLVARPLSNRADLTEVNGTLRNIHQALESLKSLYRYSSGAPSTG